MAKNPIASILAQSVAPGSVPAPGGKKVPPPKGVQKSAPQGPLPGKAPPPQPKPGKGFGGKPKPAPFGGKPPR